jgi:hypothetical protein
MIGKIINIGPDKKSLIVMDIYELVERLRHTNASSHQIVHAARENVFDCSDAIPDGIVKFFVGIIEDTELANPVPEVHRQELQQVWKRPGIDVNPEGECKCGGCGGTVKMDATHCGHCGVEFGE